jgi:hypothetical protein
MPPMEPNPLLSLEAPRQRVRMRLQVPNDSAIVNGMQCNIWSLSLMLLDFKQVYAMFRIVGNSLSTIASVVECLVLCTAW